MENLKIHSNCFYTYKKNYYSVPEKYRKQKVKIFLDKGLIWEFYPDGYTRCRKLEIGQGHYHLLGGDINAINNLRDDEYISKLLYEGRLAGENIYYLIKRIFESANKHPYTRIKSAQFILYLVDAKGCLISNEAAEYVLLGDKLGYYPLKFAINMLEKEF